MNQDKAIQDAYENISSLRKTILRIAKNHICSLVSTCSISQKAQQDLSNMEKEEYNEKVKNTFEILAVLQQKDNQLKKDINQGN